MGKTDKTINKKIETHETDSGIDSKAICEDRQFYYLSKGEMDRIIIEEDKELRKLIAIRTKELQDVIIEKDKEIERLREILKPFSNAVLPAKDTDKPDDERVTCYFKLGDLRKAQQALKEKDSEVLREEVKYGTNKQDR